MVSIQNKNNSIRPKITFCWLTHAAEITRSVIDPVQLDTVQFGWGRLIKPSEKGASCKYCLISNEHSFASTDNPCALATDDQ